MTTIVWYEQFITNCLIQYIHQSLGNCMTMFKYKKCIQIFFLKLLKYKNKCKDMVMSHNKNPFQKICIE